MSIAVRLRLARWTECNTATELPEGARVEHDALSKIKAAAVAIDLEQDTERMIRDGLIGKNTLIELMGRYRIREYA